MNGNKARVEIWRLIAPDVGTFDVDVTFSAAPTNGAVVGVVTFTGVDETTPHGTFTSDTGRSLEATVNVASAADELVFDTINFENIAKTVGANQTEHWNLREGKASGGGSTEPGAATVTVSWDVVGTKAKKWAIGAVSIKGNTITFKAQVGLANPDGTGYSQIGESASFTTQNVSGDLTDTVNICAACAAQSITATIPKRLVFRMNVTAVSGIGITLKYDAPAGGIGDSRLNTPTVVVPEYVALLVPFAVLLPPILLWRRKRRKLSRSEVRIHE